MNTRLLPILCLLPLCSLVRADDPCAQPAPEVMAEAAGVKLPALPWHVANIWWEFEKLRSA